MKTIKAKELCHEEFRKYGEYYDLHNPKSTQSVVFGGGSASEFYPDALTLHLGNQSDASVCVCSLKKRDNIIESYEYHNNCCEGILPLDADCIIFCGLGFDPVLPCEEFEAFVVPAGTFVKLKAGVNHGTQFVVDKDKATVLVILPERAFATDMNMFTLDNTEKIKVEV